MKKYTIIKTVKAKSVSDALQKDKTTDPDEVFIKKDKEKPPIGFNDI